MDPKLETALDATDSYSPVAAALKSAESAVGDLYDLVSQAGLKDLTDLDEMSGNVEDSQNALRRLRSKLEDMEA